MRESSMSLSLFPRSEFSADFAFVARFIVKAFIVVIKISKLFAGRPVPLFVLSWNKGRLESTLENVF